MKRIVNLLGILNRAKRHHVIFALCAATAIGAALPLPAQTFTTLQSFDGTDGASPSATLVQGTDGYLYGTTYGGGDHRRNFGTVFKMTPAGTLTTLYDFAPSSENHTPYSGLVQATDGYFYGTTYAGGSDRTDCSAYQGCGTVFKITPSGTLVTLYDFCSQITSECLDGDDPFAGLIQATDGDLYGTTEGGGVNGKGTIFKITLGGTLTTLYSFCSQAGCTDGAGPVGGLVQATNGDFYGTTGSGGANPGTYGTGDGTVFKITPGGTLVTLYSFCSQSACTDGDGPLAGLIEAGSGDFYGTTTYGGANGQGTVFKITQGGTLTTLYSFCSQAECTDGENPHSALVEAAGNLYGTTEGGGGVNVGGTIFKITPSGTLTTLYSFCPHSGCTDGSYPLTGLIQATNGTLYGTTELGGADGWGTVFSLSVGLGPFVETQTRSGVVGSTVKILGTDLTGATSVTFNGTTAVFDVVSTSLITATVPAGASTGRIKVITPSGTLSSNVSFRVLP
jgi:uncharacterized repeat protein (TIGR03803 family)